MKTKTQNQIALVEAKQLMVELRQKLKIQKNVIAGIRAALKQEKEYNRSAKLAAKQQLAGIRAERKAARVAKLEAQLQKLKEKQNPVGAKAIKAAKRPSPVRVLKAA
jgi:uncharacterized protein YccT (UPF0319 family)